jgi:hypothetical protein
MQSVASDGACLGYESTWSRQSQLLDWQYLIHVQLYYSNKACAKLRIELTVIEQPSTAAQHRMHALQHSR